MENLRQVLDLILDWSFLPLGLAALLLVTVGSGAWSPRHKRLVWLFGLGCLAAAFYVGIARHEWGEVLFNGQLL